MYYNIPAANFCCLCYKNLLPTGTNWLSKATFVGLTKYNLTNTAANLWTFSNNTQFYYETAAYRRTAFMILLRITVAFASYNTLCYYSTPMLHASSR